MTGAQNEVDPLDFTLKADSLLTPGMIRLWAALRDKDFYSAMCHMAELADTAVELVDASEDYVLELYQLAAAIQADQRTERTCRECGCVQDRACIGIDGRPCGWAEPDLCTSCADLLGLRGRNEEAEEILSEAGCVIVRTPAGPTIRVQTKRGLSADEVASFQRIADAIAGDGFNPAGAGPEPIQPRER